MAELATFQVKDGLLNTLEKEIWPILREKLRPEIWQWYDGVKDHAITKILGVYTVRWGSFGILAAGITAIFGARDS